jgi:hypothetical protein
VLTIYKYKLNQGRVNQIQMPMDASVISVGLDPMEDICIWALVETDNDMDERTFFVAGTGWDITEDLLEFTEISSLGTVRQGPFMWHIFEGVR